ncbi:MAG: hypothetical protein C4524_00815 [Candidatus Zixiibacteriota bacterium]|nr:MAG: hypothetical protein C4524_00815 [candidate division Zixibacteria bacterium]
MTGEVEIAAPPAGWTPHQYPAAANCPPPGYQFLTRDPGTARVTDEEWASAMIHQSKGGELWIGNTGIAISPWVIPNSQWMYLGLTSPVELWVEFETHGLVFDSPQYARISYAGWTPPEGVTYDQLVVWYWNDELGVYELIGGTNNVQEQYLEFGIGHFSRYIVAGPSN